jgi:pimeloyl-ACP methyl ester carboxylesterase
LEKNHAFVNNQGVHISYEVVGAGPPLVLQHGLSDSLAGMHEYGYVDLLKERHRLILIDARGHGQSDKPHDPDAYELKQRVTDVTAVLDALGIAQAGYFGYSMGGRIGLGLLRHAPERLASLIVGGAQPYASSSEFFRQIFKDGLEAWLNLLDQLAGPLSSATKARILNNNLDALRASITRDTPDIFTTMPTLRFPCQLIVGAKDPIAPLIERFARELPGAQFFPLAGLNHFQAYGRAELMASIILGEIFQPLTEPAEAG